MNSVMSLCRCIFKDTWKINLMRFEKYHIRYNSKEQQLPDTYLNNQNVESSLWFTNLPRKKRRTVKLIKRKKEKVKAGPVPSGPLKIECKNKELNHYKGMNYGKFDVIPLASRAWHHKKSKGDYFMILPTTEHPAFLLGYDDHVPLTFEEMGLGSKVVEQVKKMGVDFPTCIQAKAIPRIIEGESVLIAAETGCGKTLAYLLPVVEDILRQKAQAPLLNNTPFAVIILPTRELAIQVGAVAQKLCSDLGIKCLTMLGGLSKQLLLKPTVEPVDILVCSVGVLCKTMAHGLFSTALCKHVVIDEADTLLDDSFNSQLTKFITKSKFRFVSPSMKNLVTNSAQLYLVSATMPTSVDSILQGIISMDSLQTVSTIYLHKIQPHIPQLFRRLGKAQKPEELLKLVKKNVKQKLPTMIFSNKTETSNWLNLFLCENGIQSININGKMRVEDRLKQYQKFRDGMVDVISCTDITSRGLDCTRVKHVLNYEFPKFMADYIHRCGRTGRIGHVDGCFITNFISSAKELTLVQEIEKAARTERKLSRVNNNITRIIKHRVLNRV